jgi:ADP-ribose pyrophosphatase
MSKKILFDGRVIRVITEKRSLPNNSVVNLEIVEHRGAALIVPFLSKDKIIFIKQFRPVINSYIYELPAGTLESGESPMLCAKREVKEEIGYQAGKLTRMGHIYPVPGYSTEKIHIFKAEDLKLPKVASPRDKDEIIYPTVFTRKQIKDFFTQGKIIDAKTICALAMCGLI